MFNLSPLSWVGLICWIIALTTAVVWGRSFRHKQRNLMGNMAIYFTLSALVLCVAVGSLATKGLNFGLDFTGGTILELGSERMVTTTEVQQALEDFKSPELGDRMVQVGDTMQKDEEGKAYQRVVVRVTRAQATPEGGKQLENKEPAELEKHLEATPEVEEKVSRWLMLQPLFRLSNQQPELFQELARHFTELARKIPDLLRSTNESLVTLMKTAPPS